jgi:hypothetical protein
MMLRQPGEQEKRRECNQLKQVDFLQQSRRHLRRLTAVRYARMRLPHYAARRSAPPPPFR